MHRGSRRLRVFALIWAVLQFALPASAALVDARLAVASTGQAHAEETGRVCPPSHSTECAVCKHLSTSLLGATHGVATLNPDGEAGVVPTGGVPIPRAPGGATLPRAPPTRV